MKCKPSPYKVEAVSGAIRSRQAYALFTVFSGAVGEGRDTRHQAQNKKLAFRRMAESETFKKWHKLECARRLGQLANIEEIVDAQMAEINLKIEYIKKR